MVSYTNRDNISAAGSVISRSKTFWQPEMNTRLNSVHFQRGWNSARARSTAQR
jgi:hypothetical protein